MLGSLPKQSLTVGFLAGCLSLIRVLVCPWLGAPGLFTAAVELPGSNYPCNLQCLVTSTSKTPRKVNTLMEDLAF